MFRVKAQRILLVWAGLLLLVGCTGSAAGVTATRGATTVASNTPIVIDLSAATATAAWVNTASSSATAAGSATASAAISATGTAAVKAAQTLTPIPKGTPAPIQTTRTSSTSQMPSGWAFYTNPDYVQGIALHARTLWAATLGGVVAWDLDTNKPTLYTTRDGLAEIQGNDVVYCPLPDERIIVAHNSSALSAYDLNLQKWSRIPVTFDDGSTLTGITTLYCDNANTRLIVGSAEGLGILDGKTGRWRKIGPAQGLKVDRIRAIDVVGQTIWIAAGNKGAFMIMGNTIFPFNSASGFPSGNVNDLSVAADQSIWFGYSTGLVHYQDKKWNSYGGETLAGIPFLSVDYVEVGSDDRIWIASAEEGICPFSKVSLFCSTVYPGMRGMPVTDLAVGPDGIAYAGTNGGGVLVLESQRVRQLTVKNQQLLSNDVVDITGSADGKLWVATDRGVNTLDPEQPKDPWQVLIPQRNQLAYAAVSGMLPTAKGMWFFYDKQPQASYYDGSSWLQIDPNKGLTAPVLDAAIDQRGYIWFATQDGIKVWDGTLMRSYTPPFDLPGSTIHSLTNVGETMWVGADRGLMKYERFQWQVVLPNIAINAIVANPDGGLLLGTNQGLVRYDGGQSFLWIINLGDEIITNPKVTSMTFDGKGRLWVGTQDSGLFSYDGSHWERFNTATGLPTDNIRKVYTDRLGSVWIACATGDGGGALVRYIP